MQSFPCTVQVLQYWRPAKYTKSNEFLRQSCCKPSGPTWPASCGSGAFSWSSEQTSTRGTATSTASCFFVLGCHTCPLFASLTLKQRMYSLLFVKTAVMESSSSLASINRQEFQLRIKTIIRLKNAGVLADQFSFYSEYMFSEVNAKCKLCEGMLTSTLRQFSTFIP